MAKKSAKQIIDEIPLPEGNASKFVMVYEPGFLLLEDLMRDGAWSAARLYLYLIRQMEVNSGALITDIPSLVAELGMSRPSVYKGISVLMEKGHLKRRNKNLLEVNPSGAWKGRADRRSRAAFMQFGGKVSTRSIALRYGQGDGSEESITVTARFVKEKTE